MTPRALVLAALLASAPGVRAEDAVLVPRGSTWLYLPGRAEPPAGWREREFDDTAWAKGAAGFGYGDADDVTVLEDMKGQYVSLYVRREFDVQRPREIRALILEISYDDGFIAYVNGHERRGLSEQEASSTSLARDHEASGFETIPIPDPATFLLPGRNVLAIEGHNSSPHSSDFSLDAELRSTPALLRAAAPDASPALASPEETAPEPQDLPERAGTRARPTDQRVATSTMAALYHVTNYFEARAGARKQAVDGRILRADVALRLGREARVQLLLRAEGQRVGGLGDDVSLLARATLSLTPRQSLRVQADGLWNRPAYLLGPPQAQRVANADTADLQVLWSFDAPGPKRSPLTWTAWGDALSENVGLDARRDAHDRTVGGSVRFLRRLRVFSPEIGFEATWRNAGSPNLDYDQRRLSLRIRSSPSSRVYLSALARWGRRDYAADDPILYSNANRSDNQRLVRLTCDVSASSHVALSAFWSHEDGSSSGSIPGYSTSTIWGGITWTP
jgi:hypothetical protein